jgi:hypothetical protein
MAAEKRRNGGPHGEEHAGDALCATGVGLRSFSVSPRLRVDPVAPQPSVYVFSVLGRAAVANPCRRRCRHHSSR